MCTGRSITWRCEEGESPLFEFDKNGFWYRDIAFVKFSKVVTFSKNLGIIASGRYDILSMLALKGNFVHLFEKLSELENERLYNF